MRWVGEILVCSHTKGRVRTSQDSEKHPGQGTDAEEEHGGNVENIKLQAISLIFARCKT
jgi:hypothetical protein